MTRSDTTERPGLSSPGHARRDAVHAGRLVRLVRLPETGAAVGTVTVFVLFAIFAGANGFLTVEGTGNWMSDAAEIGIGGLGVGLLLIAGEFDLSIGAILGAASMAFAISITQFGLPVPIAAVVALTVGAGIGLGNGMLVVKTGLPSFLVTLATLFGIGGLTLGISKALTGATTISLDVQGASQTVLAGQWHFFSVGILWWLGLGVIGHLVLRHTVFGNWLMASGGDTAVARSAGVRTDRVKVVAYVAAAMCASLVGIMQTVQVQSADVARGQNYQFETIVAVVIGGVLLEGGYGSVIGVFLGAMTYGIAELGVFYTGWESDWFQVILGVLLLAAVLTNTWFKKKAMTLR